MPETFTTTNPTPASWTIGVPATKPTIVHVTGGVIGQEGFFRAMQAAQRDAPMGRVVRAFRELSAAVIRLDQALHR